MIWFSSYDWNLNAGGLWRRCKHSHLQDWKFEIQITVLVFFNYFLTLFSFWIEFGFCLQEYEDYDDYEDEELEEGEGYEDEEGEEYAVEEPRKPTPEELEYLELRKKLKESIRKKMKKENSISLADSSGRRKQVHYDKWVLQLFLTMCIILQAWSIFNMNILMRLYPKNNQRIGVWVMSPPNAILFWSFVSKCLCFIPQWIWQTHDEPLEWFHSCIAQWFTGIRTNPHQVLLLFCLPPNAITLGAWRQWIYNVNFFPRQFCMTSIVSGI